MPSFTIISCVLAVIRNKCKPILVDCTPDTYCIDPLLIEEKITKRTVAIMAVHIYGHPCDMASIKNITKKYSLILIEDAAEAHGSEYMSIGHKDPKKIRWEKCGSFGDLSCFSFYANKNITSGEGGIVLTSNPIFADRLRKSRNLCFLREPRFLHHELGYNFRMTNIQAALAMSQLKDIKTTLRRKKSMARQYSSFLKTLPLELPIEKKWAKSSIWMYAVLLKKEKKTKRYFERSWQNLSTKDFYKWPSYKIMKKLLKLGIDTRPFFIGMHEQPALCKMGLFKDTSLPVTEKISRSGFYLPSGQAITDIQIKKVSRGLKYILE